MVPAYSIPPFPHTVNMNWRPAGWLIGRVYEFVPLGIVAIHCCGCVSTTPKVGSDRG